MGIRTHTVVVNRHGSNQTGYSALTKASSPPLAMSYMKDPTRNAPGQVVGTIVRQHSAATLGEPFHTDSRRDQFHDADGMPETCIELTQPNKQNAEPTDDVYSSVPLHHNQDNLCCPLETPYQTFLTCCSVLPICWPCWLSSCHRLSNRKGAAIYQGGVPYAHVSASQQLWLCINPCLDTVEYSKNMQMENLDEVKAADADGSPIVLSGVVTYTIGDPWKYLVANGDNSTKTWVHNQGLVVMKEVASRYPYDAAAGQVSLRTRGSRNVVIKCLKKEMQERVNNIGLTIKSFEFTDMHYAKEVAAQMLVTQQAKATVNARRLIVDGAVSIVTETVSRLEQHGIGFNAQQKADLVRSLLVMSVSDSPAQTV